MPLALIILLVSLALIALRELMPSYIRIWHISALAALLVLVCQQITIKQAINAINYDIIGYLFGVFLIAASLEHSGYMDKLTQSLLKHIKNGYGLLLLIVFPLGILSAFLLNDTIAIIATPLIIQLCRHHRQLLVPLLLALAYAITIGSVLSPLGNPQNLLISLHSHLFILPFLQYLAVPTMINLGLLLLVMIILFNKYLKLPLAHTTPPVMVDQQLTRLSQYALIIFSGLIILNICLSLLPQPIHLNFAAMALLAASPIILGSRQRFMLIKKLDWGTIIFFISLFILVQSVWQTGYLQQQIHHWHLHLADLKTLFALSTLLSQLISNVPLVALYLPLLDHLHALPVHYLALAAASTIAGNAFVFGAASNIIILHNAEQREVKAFGFWQFSVIGIPLCLLNLFVYYIFLSH